jgi:hypothetical protein
LDDAPVDLPECALEDLLGFALGGLPEGALANPEFDKNEFDTAITSKVQNR